MQFKMTFFLARARHLAPLVIMLLGSMIAVAAYLQGLNYQFVGDDHVYLTSNAKLLGLHLPELWRLFAEPYNKYELLPLRDLSYWFDIALFGLNPSAFRIHNIILYLLCLPLVYGTTLSLWRYFRPPDEASAPWAAAAVTVLFALAPAHIETVVYISGRKDVLSGMFSLLALWVAVRAKREQGLSSPYGIATLLALLAAMLSKATAVAVSPLIALLWVMFWRDGPVPDRRRSQLLWPAAVLLLAAGVFIIFAANSPPTVKVPAYFGIETITRMLAVLGWLMRLAVSPESRHIFYPVLDDPNLSVMVALGATVLAASAFGVVLTLRKRSLEGFALTAFLLLCIPYLQLIPFATGSLVADRWLLLAIWPVILLIVALAWRLNSVPRVAILLVILLPWIFQNFERTRDWRSFGVLVDVDARAYPGYYLTAFYEIYSSELPQGKYREALETAKNVSIPRFRNGMIELVRADYEVHVGAATTGKPEEAMALLWQSGMDFKQAPDQARWNSPLYNFWGKSQDFVVNNWESLLKTFPDDALLRYKAGTSELELGYISHAAANLSIATGSQRLPAAVRGKAYRNLGYALLNSGHIAEAEVSLRAALGQTPPDLRAHCLLSEVYRQTGRADEASLAETECLKLAPADVKAL
jgi:tetratricopeptide (TPR) repeat protein